jgi:hypothetical protein
MNGHLAHCAPTRIRTWDHLLKRELLYQLSYRGTLRTVPWIHSYF